MRYAALLWPGDDVDINTSESGKYRNLHRIGWGGAIDFVTGDECRSSIFKAAIPDIPRWRYAIELNKRQRTADTGNDSNKDSGGSESDGHFDYVSAPKKLRGVPRAHRGFLDECRKISHGKNDLVEFLANRESDAPIIRLEIWRSIVSLNVPGTTLVRIRVMFFVSKSHPCSNVEIWQIRIPNHAPYI